MDTVLHYFPTARIVGKWTAINFGLVEIIDSIVPGSPIYFRTSKNLQEQQKDHGFVSVSDKRIQFSLKNIEEFPNRSLRYKILEGKYLTTHKLFNGFCGATLIGLTPDGFLLLDDLTYRTLAKKGKYLVVRTTIRRLILKKSTTA